MQLGVETGTKIFCCTMQLRIPSGMIIHFHALYIDFSLRKVCTGVYVGYLYKGQFVITGCTFVKIQN